jgi:hypothetical protein
MMKLRSQHGIAPSLWDGLAVAVLALVAVIALATFRDYGLGWDDYTHAQYGDLLVALYSSGFSDKRALSFVNLYMYGGGFDMLSALAGKLLAYDIFETRRIVGAGIGILGLLATWRLGRRLGGPFAGLVALTLLATCPLYYGHMFINPKDGPFAAAMAILLLGLVRVFQEYPRPAPASVAVFGVGLGLAIGTRVIGGIVGVYAAVALLLIVALEARGETPRLAGARAVRFVATLLPGLALAYLVMGLVWPWSVVSPLNPLRALEYFSHFFEKPWREMYDGMLLSVPDMPRSYVIMLAALKLPEIMLLLGLGGTASALLAVGRRELPVAQRAALLLIALAAILPIAYTIIDRPAMYNGIRHFVFVMPPIAVLGGFAAARLLAHARALSRPALAAASTIALVGIAAPVVEMVRLHPYQYSHFNWIAGGVRGADDRYMIDYWGLAFKQAAQALREQLTAWNETPPDGRSWKVAVCGPQRPAEVELGSEFSISWDSKGADFALMLGEFYCATLKAPVLIEVEREGVIFARVYDIRKQAVSSVLAVPAP